MDCTDICEAFSRPWNERTNRTFNIVARGVAASLVGTAREALECARGARQIDRSHDANVDLQAASTPWAPWVGGLERALWHGNIEATQDLLNELTISSCLLAPIPKSRFQFTKPVSVALGTWRLPKAIAISVSSDSSRANLEIMLERGSCVSVAFVRDRNGHWTNVLGGRYAIERRSVAIQSGYVPLLSNDLAPAEILPPSDQLRFCADDTELMSLESHFENGIGALAQSGVGYLRYVAETITSLAPIVCPPTFLTSASNERFPGVVAIARHVNPFALAEMMVHEASHQYFYLAQRFGLVSETGTTYFSPFARAERTIERILLAYHAAANIALFHRSIDHRSQGSSFCQRRLAEVMPQVIEMDQIIARDGALTKAGRAIWRPLHEALVG